MPVWIPKAAISTIYAELLAEHGGLPGPANDDALEATLARPQQRLHYSNTCASLPELAAAYGFGSAKNHCFKDGNKRVAMVAIDVFLQINGHELTASEPETVVKINALAAGQIDESQLCEWIALNSQPL
ncbi:MAG: type II toxin-antitoxin system death-on-curing family toxin [Candidatus Thiodiazotropha sp. (ex Lucinoma kastoroae)]|nr:type II toxin-antitoxin system death-on-curing family toxin [Candidatus Thiodiazotropha sp. (ex Lucinoma kastoroae)]